MVTPSTDVIVVGAGLAGLVAATELAGAGKPTFLPVFWTRGSSPYGAFMPQARSPGSAVAACMATEP